MLLSVLNLAVLPDDSLGMCELADEFITGWLPSATPADKQALSIDETEARLGRALPSSLRWAYQRFGLTGARLFNQDPLVHAGALDLDDNGMVTFRTEAQGCAAWGFLAEQGDDPAVFVATGSEHGAPRWEPYQHRLSLHLFEAVLEEATLGSAQHRANLDPSPEAVVALRQLPSLGISPHRMWTAPDAIVEWRGLPEALVRNEADTWFWAMGRDAGDLRRLTELIPGDWQVLPSPQA
jgi:hypothetical protein